MRCNTIVFSLFVAGALLLTGACAGSDSALPDDTVVVVGSDALTRSQLRAAMPGGLSPDDSTAFAQAYISNWVDRKLISNVAAAEIDMTEIDRLVDEYREELIMNRYRREMVRRADNNEFHPDSLLNYYRTHLSDFTLSQPLVKGIYLKVPDDSPELTRLKRLYKSSSPADMDRLENLASNNAIHFDLFTDRWIEWEQIEARIPTDFPEGAATFLSRGQPFEMSAGGFTYLLKVTDYLLPGSPMPYEAASSIVMDRMRNSYRRAFDSQLRRELEERALRTGRLRYL